MGILGGQEMRKEMIELLEKEGKLYAKQPNKEKARSLINSSENNAEVILSLQLDELRATIIFRELYESIRQLGEALWILEGYEPNPQRAYHETCLLIIKDTEISHKLKLSHLDRYRKIRNDANYQGNIILKEQAEELVGFWKTAGVEILADARKKLK